MHLAPLQSGLVSAGTLQEPNFTGTPAKQYPFELDPFQKTSVACLVRRAQPAIAACRCSHSRSPAAAAAAKRAMQGWRMAHGVLAAVQ